MRSQLALILATLLFGQSLLAQAPKTGYPPKINKPFGGQFHVSGWVRQANTSVRVKVYDGDGKLLAKKDVTATPEEGEFQARLDEALLPGSIVIAMHLLAGAEVAVSAPMAVGGPAGPRPRPGEGQPQGAMPLPPGPARADASPCALSPASPDLATPSLSAKAGAKEISGNATFASGTAVLCVNESPVAVASGSEEAQTSGAAFTGGKYKLKFDKELKVNQRLVLVVTDSTGRRRLSASATVASAPPTFQACEEKSSDDTFAPLVLKPKEGQVALLGTAPILEGKATVCVNGEPVVIAATNEDLKNATTKSLDFKAGTYDLNIKPALVKNQKVALILSSADGSTRYFGTATVPQTKVTGSFLRYPESVSVGQITVDVIATPTPADALYEIRVFPKDPALKLKTADNKAYVLTTPSGTASLTFEVPFYEGQKIELLQSAVLKSSGEILELTMDPSKTPEKVLEVSQIKKKEKKNSASKDATPSPKLLEAMGTKTPKEWEELPLVTPAVTVTDPGDLGRFRYYFTSGVVLSNTSGFKTPTGTQAGIFLGLNADRAWFSGDRDGWRRVNLNSYFEARLTSVATQQSASTGTGTAASLQSFSASSKAANLQAGMYIPISSRPFEAGSRGDKFSLFAGPLAKTGFTTLTDGPASSDSTPDNATEARGVTGRFFTNYSYGTRIGVFRNHRSKHSVPELIHFVDVTYGRFGGFEAFRDARAELSPKPDLSVGTPYFITQRPWRWQFEGQLKIPYTPFIVGFNANLGRGATPTYIKSGLKFPYSQPKDDLRFLFGAQFDAGRLFKLLPSIQ